MVYSPFSRPSDVRRAVKPRGLYSHKGDFGHLLIIGGSDVYSGAPALAGMAALRTGVGLALIAAPREVAGTIRSYSPNLIVHSLTGSVVMGDDVNVITQLLTKADAVVLGSGIGLDPRTEKVIPEIVRITTEMNKPLLIDADAIKAIRGRIELLGQAGTVITPHAGEFSFISGMDAPSKWRERGPICIEFAKKHSCVLLLKGHDTVITDGKRTRVNPTGNPGMATGGSGDVLSGIIGAFLAQGVDPFLAAVAGAFVHGLAGDLAHKEKGFHMIASDLIDVLPKVLKRYDRGCG